MNYIEIKQCENVVRDKTEFERVVDENQNIAKRLNELLNHARAKLITVQLGIKLKNYTANLPNNTEKGSIYESLV